MILEGIIFQTALTLILIYALIIQYESTNEKCHVSFAYQDTYIYNLVNFHLRRIICLKKILKLQNYVIPSLSVCYKNKSVQIRDIGRFLAEFNPWTNTFGNRLVRLHCSRIHPSVKLSTPKIYTCSLIVAVSWKKAF